MKAWLLPLLLLLCPFVHAQVTPDCVIGFTFTAASQNSSTTGCGNNTQGVVEWRMTYAASSGISALSIVVQSAPDNGGTPGSWSTFAGTTEMGTNNPNTTTPQCGTTCAALLGYYPWVRVFLTSLTGTGTIRGQLYGCRQPGCAGSVAQSGGSGMCPEGPTLSIQFNANGTMCGGMTGSQVFDSDGSIVLNNGANAMVILSSNPEGETAGPGSGAVFALNIDGIGPPDVSSSTGTDSGYVFLQMTAGGNTTIATSGQGGLAGEFLVMGNTGGTAPMAAVNSEGGEGSDIELDSGPGGDASSGATSNTGGRAGSISFNAANGGDATTGAGTNNGGDGGSINLRAGTGGHGTDGAANEDGHAGKVQVELSTGIVNGKFTVSGVQSEMFIVDYSGTATIFSTVFASLGTPSNGSEVYCSDCKVASSIDNTCAATGTGAWASQINGAWKCAQ